VQTKCNLIIDSACDLPAELLQDEGITLLHFTYATNDMVYPDDLWQNTSHHMFFEGIRKGATYTTQSIAPMMYEQAFEGAIKDGKPAVALLFTSGLSGSFQIAEMAADRVRERHPEAELYVVDTLRASIAEGVLVYEALRQRARGMSAAELAQWALEARHVVNNIFMVEDLDCLKRGGRIPASVAFAGSKLDVKPMLFIDADGKLSMCGVVRGRKKGIKHMIEVYLKSADMLGANRCVVIAGSDCEKDVKNLREQLQKADANVLIIESQIGAVIGSHVGAGMLAMAWWGQDLRKEESITDRIARKVKGEK